MDIDIEHLHCIGILGGTFNPVHNGHIMMAECALQRKKNIERLIFMPNNLPAYKDTDEIIDTEHRINMLRIALRDRSKMCISGLEIERGGITYTADTLDELLSWNPGLKIYFIIGTDSLKSFDMWFRYRDILQSCTLLVAVRNTGQKNQQLWAQALLRQVPSAEIEFLDNDEIPAASSDIREQLAAGHMPDTLLPKGVADYIRQHGLYGFCNHTDCV